jgi:transcriptional regulator with XRE-family HTH domain
MNTTASGQGHNVKRIREILGIKQESIAASLGLSQQAISQLEQKEVLDSLLLEKLSKILGVSEEAIKNFSEESAVNIISNTYNDQVVSIQYNFNPIDKIVELYERLLKSEKEKNELLQQLLAKNNISQ